VPDPAANTAAVPGGCPDDNTVVEPRDLEVLVIDHVLGEVLTVEFDGASP